MLEKLPFLVLVLLGPYQIYRIWKTSNKDKKIIEILSGGVIIIMCTSSWPIYLSLWLCFFFIGLLFASVMGYEGWKSKKATYWFTSVALTIMSFIFLIFYFSNVKI